jgi:Leu/Phe-tRNA-protein transferase
LTIIPGISTMWRMGEKKNNSGKKSRRDNVLRIRLTDEERKLIDDCAKSKNLDTSTWARWNC